MFTRRQDTRAETGPAELAGDGQIPLASEPGRTTPPPLGAEVRNPAQPQAASAAASGGDPAGVSVIGQDLTIDGQSITIRCAGALHVNGNISAELHSKQIVVGRSGTVHGSITAEQVDIWGQVSGAIKGRRVLLHGSAEVEGDIHAATLSMENGAMFEGRSRKVADPDSIVPQLVADGDTGRETTASEPIPLPRAAAVPLSQ